MKLPYKISYVHFLIFAFVVLFSIFISLYPSVFIADINGNQITQDVTQNARVDTTSAGLTVKVAPGDILPISVKLLNFGGGKRVDVTITYGIFDSTGKQVHTTTETIAVETTASFVKTIQIPFGTPPGKYIAKASLVYQDQLVPATTQFSFTVENKIIGLFQSDFYFYGIIVLIMSIIAGIVGYLWRKKYRFSRLTLQEYSKIPNKDRIFYEIISDTIMQMRYRVGDKALDIAKSIEDLVIDANSGKVLQVKADPAKIIALLILKYEKLLGQKVSFAIPKTGGQIEDNATKVDKNLVVIKKYFE